MHSLIPCFDAPFVQIFCVATFLTSVSFFGTLISELNEIMTTKVMERVGEVECSIEYPPSQNLPVYINILSCLLLWRESPPKGSLMRLRI